MASKKEIEQAFALATQVLHLKIQQALEEFNQNTSIFCKGTFGFYTISGYGDKPPIVRTAIDIIFTFDPQTIVTN